MPRLFHARSIWTLRLGLIVMFTIAIGAALSSVEAERRLWRSAEIHNYQRALDQIQLAMLRMSSGQRGYLITGGDNDLLLYEEGRRAIVRALEDFTKFDQNAMALPAPGRPIGQLVADRLAELDDVISRRRVGAPASIVEDVRESGAGRKSVVALRDELNELHGQASLAASRYRQHGPSETYIRAALIIAGLMLAGGLSTVSDRSVRREIAVRETIEAELRERQTELARSNAELEQFAQIASHDLQEPLRMISGYTQLLRRRYADKLDADANTFIGYAVDATKRMQALINDLLSFSRVSSHAKPLESVDLQAALADTLRDLEVRIEDTCATVTHEPLPTVRADPVQMRQLLLNLIGNGMKFHPPERKPEVRVSAALEGKEWRFGVTDNGIGIDARYFNNLFQIFKRLHSREEFPGTGIGLAVCKKIVERHGGRIWVESVLGQGSTFHFTLPALEAPS